MRNTDDGVSTCIWNDILLSKVKPTCTWIFYYDSYYLVLIFLLYIIITDLQYKIQTVSKTRIKTTEGPSSAGGI